MLRSMVMMVVMATMARAFYVPELGPMGVKELVQGVKRDSMVANETWDVATNNACVSKVTGEISNPLGMFTCYNIFSYNITSGAFESELRVYQKNDSIEAAYYNAGISIVLGFVGGTRVIDTADTSGNSSSTSSLDTDTETSGSGQLESSDIKLFNTYQFGGYFNVSEVSSHAYTVAELVTPQMKVLVESNGTTSTQTLGDDSVNYVNGVASSVLATAQPSTSISSTTSSFSSHTSAKSSTLSHSATSSSNSASITSSATVSVPSTSQTSKTSSASASATSTSAISQSNSRMSLIKGTSIVNTPIGLYMTASWCALLLAVAIWGISGRMKQRSAYRKRLEDSFRFTE